MSRTEVNGKVCSQSTVFRQIGDEIDELSCSVSATALVIRSRPHERRLPHVIAGGISHIVLYPLAVLSSSGAANDRTSYKFFPFLGTVLRSRKFARSRY